MRVYCHASSPGSSRHRGERPVNPNEDLVGLNAVVQEPSTVAGEIDATQSRRPCIPDDSAVSDRASLSSLEDMLHSDAEEDLFHTDQFGNRRDALSPEQHSAIEDIVSQSLHSALHAVRANSAFSPTPNQTLAASGMASPLGLSRPVDQNMENKILRGEFVDLPLLLPDNLYQSQTPEIQLRLDDSSSGPMGSPVTMIRKRKPVIDSFRSGWRPTWCTCW